MRLSSRSHWIGSKVCICSPYLEAQESCLNAFSWLVGLTVSSLFLVSGQPDFHISTQVLPTRQILPWVSDLVIVQKHATLLSWRNRTPLLFPLLSASRTTGEKHCLCRPQSCQNIFFICWIIRYTCQVTKWLWPLGWSRIGSNFIYWYTWALCTNVQ